MRGKPLARTADDVATVTGGPARPSRDTRRARTATVSPPVRSIHVTSAAAPPSSIATSTRPAGVLPSTRTGGAKRAPASSENATCTFALSFAPVNHASATRRPAAATAGPLTGQAAIFQWSACTAAPGVHRPPTRRVT